MTSTVTTRSRITSPGLSVTSTGCPWIRVWLRRNRRRSVPEKPAAMWSAAAAPQTTGHPPHGDAVGGEILGHGAERRGGDRQNDRGAARRRQHEADEQQRQERKRRG